MLGGAAVAWLALTGGVLAWSLAQVPIGASEHMVGHWQLGMMIMTPLWLVSLLPLAILVQLRRASLRAGGPGSTSAVATAAAFGLAWGILGVLGAAAALLPVAWVVAMAFEPGGHLAFALRDPIIVAGNPAQGTYYRYVIDLAPLAWLVAAFVGLVASARLLPRPNEPRSVP